MWIGLHKRDAGHTCNVIGGSMDEAEEIIYGRSGTGKYPLAAYKLGDGENILVVTFAIHGYEDAFEMDGLALVRLGERLIRRLSQEEELLRDKNWTVYVLPCLNPDGLFLGESNNGPGRATTTCYDASGTLQSGNNIGIDMNRSFPYRFIPYEDARNFNGDEPLLAEEARCLAGFTEEIMGEKANVLIDVHGWYQQILTTEGENFLYESFHTYFPECTYMPLTNGFGYYSAWAGYELGYDSCLIELPGGVESMEDFEKSGDTERFMNAILMLLKDY